MPIVSRACIDTQTFRSSQASREQLCSCDKVGSALNVSLQEAQRECRKVDSPLYVVEESGQASQKSHTVAQM